MNEGIELLSGTILEDCGQDGFVGWVTVDLNHSGAMQMTPEQAREFAFELIKRAHAAEADAHFASFLRNDLEIEDTFLADAIAESRINRG